MREPKMRVRRSSSPELPARLLRPVLLACSLFAAPPAWAAPASQTRASKVARAEALYAKGAAYFNQGDFREALQRFEAAFALVEEPNLLFNIGRCLEALGRLEEARSFYLRCATEEGVTPRTASVARQRAQALEVAIAAARKARNQRVRLESSSAPLARSRRTAPNARVSSARPAAPAGARSSLWTWVALGAGTALMVGGGILVALGQADHDEVLDKEGYGDTEAVLDITRAEATDLDNSGNAKKIAGFVLLGVGGVAVATAAALFVMDTMGGPERQTADRSHNGLDGVGLALTPTNGGAAALLQGRF